MEQPCVLFGRHSPGAPANWCCLCVAAAAHAALHSHFFFFFFPTVIMANNLARLTMLAAFITGPLFTQMLAARYAETYKFEW